MHDSAESPSAIECMTKIIKMHKLLMIRPILSFLNLSRNKVREKISLSSTDARAEVTPWDKETLYIPTDDSSTITSLGDEKEN